MVLVLGLIRLCILIAAEAGRRSGRVSAGQFRTVAAVVIIMTLLVAAAIATDRVEAM